MRQSWFEISSFAILALCFDARFEAHAEDWPMWRGSRGDGIGQGADVPLTWSSTEMATRNEKNVIVSTGFVELAKKSGLLVHPYTVRTLQQPRWSTSLDETHRVLIDLLKVDGFFTDFPDLGRKAVGPR